MLRWSNDSMTGRAAVFLFQLVQGIVVETDSPDALCPDLHRTREAVSARLGTIQGTGWRARYTIVHAPGEMPRDYVLLELSSPQGTIPLRRELPIGESCAAVADAIALVLDQYFRTLVAPEEMEPDEVPMPPLNAASHPVERRVADAPAEKKRPSFVTPHRPSWLAMLEAAAVSFPSSFAPGLRLQALLSPSWHAGLELAIPLSERFEALPAGGEARARSFELNAHVGFGPELGALRPYLAPTLFGLLERAYATPPLASTPQYRLLGGVALELGLNASLGEPWRTVAFASGGRIFAESATFVIGGEEVLDGIAWVGKVGLGVAYVF
jgi:hypothetical protein